MSTRFSKLFEPVKIGKVEIQNRIAMAPMGIGGLLNPDGSPGPRALDYYLERARGGVGLIITGVFKVENEVEALIGAPPLISLAALSPFAELAESVHSLGARIFVQVTAGFGRVVGPRRMEGPPVSASAIPYYWDPSQTCRELKTDEVERLIKAFGKAAAILAAAGIDGVELHGHEGYLFDQFTTSLWNKRTDRYGGGLDGRLRLPIEVLEEIKGAAGQDFPVQYRFGLKHNVKKLNSGALPGEKFREAGRDTEEGVEMARRLEAAGFDALHVDAGCYDSWYWPHPPVYQKPGAMIQMAALAKKAVRIPVIGVGKLGFPELAEKAVSEGQADIVAIGKSLLTDPLWVKKVREGTPDRIRPCIGCHDGCMGRMFKGRPLSCAVNPATGRERSYALARTGQPLKVVVAGGGVAGLEAARVACLKGHRVILFEKTGSIGGHLLEASVPDFKNDLGRLLGWYKKEMEVLKPDIRTGVAATAEMVIKEKPDVAIIATGSKPIVPDIPGAEKMRMIPAADLLLGKEETREKVLVLGGGLIGCETALWLAQHGKKVTLVELLDDILTAGIPVQHMNRLMLVDLLNYHGVEIRTGLSLVEVAERECLFLDRDSHKKSLPAETLVLAVGLQPERDLYDVLRSEIPNVYLIGDSRKPQNVMNAIWDAYEVARMI